MEFTVQEKLHLFFRLYSERIAYMYNLRICKSKLIFFYFKKISEIEQKIQIQLQFKNEKS